MPIRSVEDRFWDKVDERGVDDCWEWTAATVGGYGRMWVLGSDVQSHRLSWELNVGTIPKGKMVLHDCDNRRCCNPDHLFLGTNADNTADMDRKGRRKGGGLGMSQDQAEEIRSLKGRERQVDIARRLKVSPQSIQSIWNGKTWKPDRKPAVVVKLKESQVQEIRRLRGSETAVSLAARFEVHSATVRRVWSGESWKQLAQPPGSTW